MKKIYNEPTLIDVNDICDKINVEIWKQFGHEEFWLPTLTFQSNGDFISINFLNINLWSTEDPGDWEYDYHKDKYKEDFEAFIKRMILKHIMLLTKLSFE